MDAKSEKNIKNKGKESEKMSKSKLAGLTFPVGKIAKYLKLGENAPRIAGGVPIFLAGTLEYLASEILEYIRK